MRDDYIILCPSFRNDLFEEVKRSLAPLQVHWFDGSTANSFSHLINQCIVKCHDAGKEILVVAADRYRPKAKDVERALDLIDKGYGLAATGNFGFFALSMAAVREVGPFDERYPSGPADTDMMIRMAAADIAIYEAAEIPNERYNTSWRNANNHFEQKWKKEGDTYLRLLPEEDYKLNLGKGRGTFLPWSESVTIFPELKRLTFPRSRWNSRVIPTWTFGELWEKFVLLCIYKLKNWRRKGRLKSG